MREDSVPNRNHPLFLTFSTVEEERPFDESPIQGFDSADWNILTNKVVCISIQCFSSINSVICEQSELLTTQLEKIDDVFFLKVSALNPQKNADKTTNLVLKFFSNFNENLGFLNYDFIIKTNDFCSRNLRQRWVYDHGRKLYQSYFLEEEKTKNAVFPQITNTSGWMERYNFAVPIQYSFSRKNTSTPDSRNISVRGFDQYSHPERKMNYIGCTAIYLSMKLPSIVNRVSWLASPVLKIEGFRSDRINNDYSFSIASATEEIVVPSQRPVFFCVYFHSDQVGPVGSLSYCFSLVGSAIKVKEALENIGGVSQLLSKPANPYQEVAGALKTAYPTIGVAMDVNNTFYSIENQTEA